MLEKKLQVVSHWFEENVNSFYLICNYSTIENILVYLSKEIPNIRPNPFNKLLLYYHAMLRMLTVLTAAPTVILPSITK